MYEPIQYVEETAMPLPRKFLDDEAYADALEAFVLVCTDCVFVNRERRTFYLAKRKSKPLSEWWFIGGRSFEGEPELVSMCRCLKRETGLAIKPDRLRFLTMKRYLFKDRQQTPQDKSCDSLCYIFALDVTDEEIATANASLDPEEYDTELGLQKFGPKELVGEGVFPPIIDLYELVFHGATVERFSERDHEEWTVCPDSENTFEDSTVWLSGKPEINSRSLLERIPNEKRPEAFKLLDNKGGIKFGDIESWSRLSIILGATFVIHSTIHYLGVIGKHYYTVFPDGTVQHRRIEDSEPDKLEDRRPVRNGERRLFKCGIQTFSGGEAVGRHSIVYRDEPH